MWKRENSIPPAKCSVPSDISKSIDKNIENYKNIFKDNENLKIRKFKSRGLKPYQCAVIYLEGVADLKIISERFIEGIMKEEPEIFSDPISDIYERMSCECDIQKESSEEKIITCLVYGDCILFAEGCDKALIANTKGWKCRAITEPENEKVLTGPREGFNEKISDNISLLQRRLCTPDFKIKYVTCGRRSNTRIAICYLGSLAKEALVKTVTEKLSAIDIDAILDSNYVEEMISDNKFSPFKTTGSTERPDTAAARLLEGRVAIIVNGSPAVLTVPYLFIENFQTSDDYYLNYISASVGRILRIFCFLIATSIPAIYVALLTVHKEMMPTNLALSIIAARSSVPFPVIIECLGLILVFEIIRETALRMPSNVAQAFSIVGAIVIGDAAVQAKFVSVPMVIMVSLSALTGLMIPRLNSAVVVYRVVFVILAGLLGLYGFLCGILFMAVKLLDMKSFGFDHMTRITPEHPKQMNDIYFRFPWKFMKKRPFNLSNDRVRQKSETQK